MSEKKLVLIIEANHNYIHNPKKDENSLLQNSCFFSALTQTYIPLLNMFCKLENEKIAFKVGLAISPVLCDLLANTDLQEKYITHLDNLIELGKLELTRCKSLDCEQIAKDCLESIKKTKNDFVEVYQRNILAKIKYFERLGFLELIPTAATFAYLPHYSDFPESINAQIETGLYSHKHFFGESGDGFWLPYKCWSKNLEWALRSYGVNYTVVDPRSILFSKESSEKGIFAPVRTRTSLVLFGSDPDTPKDIMGEDGYCSNEVYRSQQLDIGFDLQQEKLASIFGEYEYRFPTGYKYWSNESEDVDLVPYDKEAAKKQVIKDAISFYEAKAAKLKKAQELLEGESPVLVCTIPAEVLGQTWYEGVDWLENVFRCTDSKKGFSFDLCKNLIENQFTLPKITPYPCSSNGLGYGEDFLDNTNSWMIHYIRKATQRMIDLTERFPSETSLKERLLNMAAKQLLLAQSSDWPKMIFERKMPEYATKLFKDEILSFSKVFDSLASNTVSTEWLTECERKNKIFPWLNYRIFSRKK